VSLKEKKGISRFAVPFCLSDHIDQKLYEYQYDYYASKNQQERQEAFMRFRRFVGFVICYFVHFA